MPDSCLTEARVPEFQRGEKRHDLKPAMYVILHGDFYVIPFFSPLKLRNSCLSEARVCHRLNIDLKWLLKVKGHGQTPKTLKSNISKTVLDREKISIEVS